MTFRTYLKVSIALFLGMTFFFLAFISVGAVITWNPWVGLVYAAFVLSFGVTAVIFIEENRR